MSRLNRLLLPAALALACAEPAAAQGSRTFVSLSGNNDNSCIATSPCRSFSRAHEATSDGGIIFCLDAGEFGLFEVTKSITIDCSEVAASIVAASQTTGILIDTPGIDVVVRGLLITGGPNAVPGGRGISFVRGNSLTVENVRIQDFNFVGANNGFGIRFAPTLAARLTVINATITDNGAGTSGGGIAVVPSGAGYASVTLEDVRLVSNLGEGLFLDTRQSSGASSNVSVTRGLFSGSNNGVSVVSSGVGASVNLVASAVSGNNSSGLRVNGANARIIASASTITGNSTGLTSVSGGIVATLGNNNLFGNGVNGAFNGFLTQD